MARSHTVCAARRPDDAVPWLHRAGWVALALTIWLLSHPYGGIWHDARIYLVLALQRLMPEAYARDIWFAFGSQGGFSLFDEVYAGLLLWAPPATVAKALALAGGVFWVAGLLALGVRLLGWRDGVIAACLVTILNPSYDLGASIFFIAESFATARPFAMGLTLAGLASWIAGRRIAAALLLAAALTLHPLMAVGVVAVIVALSLRDRAVLGLLLTGLTVLVLGAWAGLTPLAPMDPLWASLVRHTSAIVFPEDAASVNLDRNLWPVTVLLLAGRLAPPGHRRIYQSVALVTAWCVLTALVVGLHYPAVLLAQAQIWRVSWLAMVVALFACFDIAAAQPAPLRRAAALGLAVTYLAAGSGLGSPLASAAYAALLFPPLSRICQSLWQKHLHDRTRKLLVLFVILWAAGLAYLHFGGHTAVEIGWPTFGVEFEAPPFLVHTFVPAVVVLGVWLMPPRPRALVSVTLLAVALLLWDQRTMAARLQEAGYLRDSDSLLRQLNIRRGDVVYWPGNDLGPWFTLGTAGYAQSVQAIGIVFSRKHALTLHARLKTINELSKDTVRLSSTSWIAFDLHAPPYHPSRLSGDAIRRLCADKELDHIIQHQAADGMPAHTVTRTRRAVSPLLHAYHCALLRSEPG